MKLAIFIDGAYLDKVLKNEFNETRVDYKKIPIELCAGKEILRTYYYHCAPYQSNPPTPEESTRFSKAQRFHNALNSLPKFEIRLGRLVYRNGDFTQKGVDTLLSVDLVNLAASGKISDAVLMAGDSDYIPAIKATKENGVNVTLFHSQFRGSYHIDLWNLCDERFPMDQPFIDRIKLI